MLCAVRYLNTFRNMQEAEYVVIYFRVCFAVVGINVVKKPRRITCTSVHTVRNERHYFLNNRRNDVVNCLIFAIPKCLPHI